VILSRTHSFLWAFWAFWLFAIAAPAAFGQEMTRFELEEREQVEEDTTEVDWMNDTTGVDTIEYRAVDLVYDVDRSTFNLNNSAQLKDFCDKNGIPCTLINYPDEGHNFVVWKYGLYNFAQLIFK
jgi:enterochelin esterase-like enzyme